MSDATRILIVDDDPIVAENLADFLEREGYGVAIAGDGNEALAMLDTANAPEAERDEAHGPFGLVITDQNMPRCDGVQLLREVKRRHPAVSVIIVTGFAKIESAVEAIKAGAVEYLTKPIVDDELRIAVNKAMQQHALLEENRHLRSQLDERYGLGSLVGADYRMQKVYDLVEAVAPSKTTVLIEGESGTGKSMVARAVHAQSDRRSGPFITFSCGAIPETLLESELFGHVKGAFTGADADKPGRIVAAEGGTLFIDEINSATPALQLKLLRVLQERKFEPVGSHKTVNADVRFVLATNQSLQELVEKGLFREDLFYRINVVNIRMPSMRERIGDIQLLADHFLQKHCRDLDKTITGLAEEALAALRRHSWPGNVRELENAIERAVVLSRKPVIELEDLPEPVQAAAEGREVGLRMQAFQRQRRRRRRIRARSSPRSQVAGMPMPLEQALEAHRKSAILKAALEANEWNRQKTAAELDINRTTLYKKIKKYGLDEPDEQ